jgi:two-component system, chemotaxis family, chemotaxis protein CheY
MSGQQPILKSQIEDTSTLKGVNSDGSPITVVVADDEISHRKIMVQILRSMGCNVIGEAGDANEAIYQYNLQRPQLMTLDYHMGKTNGLTALIEIKRLNPNAVVVMTTSENHVDLVREVLRRGAVDYILKPFERASFIEKIEKIIIQHVRNKEWNQRLSSMQSDIVEGAKAPEGAAPAAEASPSAAASPANASPADAATGPNAPAASAPVERDPKLKQA